VGVTEGTHLGSEGSHAHRSEGAFFRREEGGGLRVIGQEEPNRDSDEDSGNAFDCSRLRLAKESRERERGKDERTNNHCHPCSPAFPLR
jgi:hypothetical protein